MSRSYRKHPYVTGYFRSKSEKRGKQKWHRKMRAAVRHVLHNADPDTVFLPHECELADLWCFGKDGKMRFDPQEQPKLMRK